MTTRTPYIPEALRDRLGERLMKSLRLSGTSIEEMAAYLEVHRNTISNWLNNRGAPANAAILRLWAQYVGLPYEWIRDGKWPKGEPEPDPELLTLRNARS